jgi:microcystin-dependent protein
MKTKNLQLPLMVPFADNKDAVYNDSMLIVDAICNGCLVSTRLETDIPSWISEGDMFLVGLSENTDLAGLYGYVAVYTSNGLRFFQPSLGLILFSKLEQKNYQFDGINWTVFSSTIQPDWGQANEAALDFIKNKPTIPAAQVSSDWNATSGVSQILNKPTIPAAQVNANWNATSGVSQILNKPTIPAAQVNANWNATSGVSQILNKPTLFSGSYTDLTNKPAIPAAQVSSDWNATSGVSQILNKPTIPAAQIQVDWAQTNTAALDFIKNKPNIPTNSGVSYFTGQVLHGQLAQNDFSGWLKWTDGRVLSKTTYALLWTWIQVNGLVGRLFLDSGTNFTMGSMCGRVIGVAGQGSGLTNRNFNDRVGAETHTLSINEMPSHQHQTVIDTTNGYAVGHPQAVTRGATSSVAGTLSDRAGASGQVPYTSALIQPSGGGQAHNNMQPTVFLNSFIYSGLTA